MADINDKELEKLNRNMSAVLKSFEKMGKTVAEATDAIIRACKLMQEAEKRKQEQMWYKQETWDKQKQPVNPIDILTKHSEVVDVERHNFDMADEGSTDHHVDIQKMYCDGELIKVFQTIDNGDPKDITDEYVEEDEDKSLNEVTQGYIASLCHSYHLEESYDVMTNSKTLIFRSHNDGVIKIEKVFRADRGMEKIIDITEEYLKELNKEV